MRLFAVWLLTALALALAADVPLVEPKDLAAQLQAKGPHPTLIHVGFNMLYRNRHIPGSIYAGSANTPQGLAALRAAAGPLARNADVVIYCGCCPWTACPNIKPAMDLLKQMGFTHVRALNIPTNMLQDWFNKGYPSEEGH